MENEFVENSTAVAITESQTTRPLLILDGRTVDYTENSTATPAGTVENTEFADTPLNRSAVQNTEQAKVEMMSATEYALLELLKDLAKGIPAARLALGSGDTAYLPKGHIKEILTTAGYAPDFVEDVDGWEGPVDACGGEASEESIAGQGNEPLKIESKESHG